MPGFRPRRRRGDHALRGRSSVLNARRERGERRAITLERLFGARCAGWEQAEQPPPKYSAPSRGRPSAWLRVLCVLCVLCVPTPRIRASAWKTWRMAPRSLRSLRVNSASPRLRAKTPRHPAPSGAGQPKPILLSARRMPRVRREASSSAAPAALCALCVDRMRNGNDTKGWRGRGGGAAARASASGPPGRNGARTWRSTTGRRDRPRRGP